MNTQKLHLKKIPTKLILPIAIAVSLAFALTSFIFSLQKSALASDRQEKIMALEQKVAVLEGEKNAAKSEATRYADDALLVEQCRQAGRAIAVAGIERNGLLS